jgi:uncharacterized protein (DUF4415 family)
MSNLSEFNRQRLLSAEDAAEASAARSSGESSKSKSKSKKEDKKSALGRRSPSPIGAEAKRRASVRLDDDFDDDSSSS